jgi:hypothetical protein
VSDALGFWQELFGEQQGDDKVGGIHPREVRGPMVSPAEAKSVGILLLKKQALERPLRLIVRWREFRFAFVKFRPTTFLECSVN